MPIPSVSCVRAAEQLPETEVQEGLGSMRIAYNFVLITFLFIVSPVGHSAERIPAAAGNQLSVDQMLSIAEKQHEIAKLLIKEGNFDRVLPEMRQILDLNLQGEYEQAVAKSVGFIAYQLAENRQYALGHELLDEALERMRQTENIASLLKIKAYIFKAENKIGKAIETLERAVEIERQRAQ
jgi:tetratricopeptide (TPR) repeat protein